MRTLGPWALMGQAHLQPPWPHDLPKPVLDSTPPWLGQGLLRLSWEGWQAGGYHRAMEAKAGPVLYQKLLLSEQSLESEEEGETSEPLVHDPWRPQDSSG